LCVDGRFLDFVALQGNDYTAHCAEAVKTLLEQRFERQLDPVRLSVHIALGVAEER